MENFIYCEISAGTPYILLIPCLHLMCLYEPQLGSETRLLNDLVYIWGNMGSVWRKSWTVTHLLLVGCKIFSGEILFWSFWQLHLHVFQLISHRSFILCGNSSPYSAGPVKLLYVQLWFRSIWPHITAVSLLDFWCLSTNFIQTWLFCSCLESSVPTS